MLGQKKTYRQCRKTFHLFNPLVRISKVLSVALSLLPKREMHCKFYSGRKESEAVAYCWQRCWIHEWKVGSAVELFYCWEGLIHKNIMDNTMLSTAMLASLEITDILTPYTLHWDTSL